MENLSTNPNGQETCLLATESEYFLSDYDPKPILYTSNGIREEKRRFTTNDSERAELTEAQLILAGFNVIRRTFQHYNQTKYILIYW